MHVYLMVFCQVRCPQLFFFRSHLWILGRALEKIMESDITELVVTNSIPQKKNVQNCPRIKVIDIAPMMAEAIRRTHNGESISVLFPM